MQRELDPAPADAPPAPRATAVCVGIARYRDRGVALPPLPAPPHDAGVLHDLFTRAGIESVRLPAAPDDEVTLDAILAAVAAQCRRAGPAGRFYFFFAGHGLSQESTDGDPIVRLLLSDGALVAIDTVIDAAEGPATQFYFVDACRTRQAGLLVRERDRVVQRAGRQVHQLFATSDGEVASGVAREGVFSRVLAKALRAEGPALSYAEGRGFWLTFGSVCRFVRERMIDETRQNLALAAVQLPQWLPATFSETEVLAFADAEALECRVALRVRAPSRDHVVKLRRLALHARPIDVAPGASTVMVARGVYEVVTATSPAGAPMVAGAPFALWTATAMVIIDVAPDGRVAVGARDHASAAVEHVTLADAQAWSAWQRDPIPAQDAAAAIGRVEGWGGRWCSLAIAVAPGCAAVPSAVQPHLRRVRFFPTAPAPDDGHRDRRRPPRPTPPVPAVLAGNRDVVLIRHDEPVAELRRVSHARPADGTDVYVLALRPGAGGVPAVAQFWGKVVSSERGELLYRCGPELPLGLLGGGVFDADTGALLGLHLDVRGDLRRAAGTWTPAWRSTWLRG